MTSQRLTWIDLAKVVSICLVTSYHTEPQLTGYAAQLVQLLRMPAFFLIAGFLFNDLKFSSLWALVKHRAKQLLVPYLCFEVLLIAITSRSLSDVSDAVGNALLGHPTVCFPLWFLVCLFGMQLIHYIGIRLTQQITHHPWQQHWCRLLGIYIIIGVLLSHVEVTQHFQFNAIVTNLPFYAAANCCKGIIAQTSWRQKRTAICLVCGLLLITLKCYWLSLFGQGNPWVVDAGYYVVHLLAGFTLLPPYIATCKTIAQVIGQRRIIEYLGSNTVVILALHTYLIAVLSQTLTWAFGAGALSAHPWLNPCLTIIIVLCHYPIIWVINRWTPWMLGRARQTAG